MKLLLLRCPACQRPLKAQDRDLILLCQECGAAVHIQDNGPALADIQYAVRADYKGEMALWRPFWVFTGQVTLHKREVQSKDGFLSNSSAEAAQQLWGKPRRLFTPAWDLPLSEAQRIGCHLIEAQGEYRQVERPSQPQLLPAALAAADAQKLLEFIVAAIEARRKDMLRDLKFSIQINQTELWALPQ
jgi:uncharacterized protein YbaR (Trm112 family)